MESHKEKICFSSNIKLTPALGDWTTLKTIQPDLEEINISKVQEISFDTLPKKLFKYTLFMHYRFAEYLTTKLSNDLNIKIELHSIKTFQLPYKEFIENQKETLIQSDLTIGSFGKINILIEQSFADMIINRISGGKGEIVVPTNNFSDLELEILSLQINELLPSFCQIWKNILNEEDIKVEVFHGKFQADQKVSLRETYIYYNFYFIFGEKILVKIIMGYPNYILRSLLNIKNKILESINKRVALNNKTLEKIKINLLAILGKTNLTMKELRNLQVGDILTLENKIEEPLELYLGNKIKYFVQPGVANNKLAAQLLFLKEDDKISPFVSKNRVKKIKRNSKAVNNSLKEMDETKSIEETKEQVIEKEEENKKFLSEPLTLKNKAKTENLDDEEIKKDLEVSKESDEAQDEVEDEPESEDI
ncbi:MAG: FliM/FliN family flagellar motor switch protein, partial [Candidatus Margulisiibacteriota bacterium]